MKLFLSILTFLVALAPVKAARPDSLLFVSCKVMTKQEIWNRRSNPHMGRPDWLEEIRLTVTVNLVVQGEGVVEGMQILLSIREQELLAQNKLAPGDEASFMCVPGDSFYQVLGFYNHVKATPSVPAPVVEVKPVLQPAPLIDKDSLSESEVSELLEKPEEISGRLILKFDNLRTAALQKISAKYHLAGAELITLTSFSGPKPPEGGYVYWGVKGVRNGKQMLWQPGYELREGLTLEDPLLYQK